MVSPSQGRPGYTNQAHIFFKQENIDYRSFDDVFVHHYFCIRDNKECKKTHKGQIKHKCPRGETAIY